MLRHLATIKRIEGGMASIPLIVWIAGPGAGFPVQ